MMAESAMLIRKLVKETFGFIDFKKTKHLFISLIYCLVIWVNLLPGDSTKANRLHEGSGQVEEHIPKTIDCLSQDASLQILRLWLTFEIRLDPTSTPVVPSLRVTLVRDIACIIHCSDSVSLETHFATKRREAYMAEAPLTTSQVFAVKLVHAVNHLNKFNIQQ